MARDGGGGEARDEVVKGDFLARRRPAARRGETADDRFRPHTTRPERRNARVAMPLRKPLAVRAHDERHVEVGRERGMGNWELRIEN